MSTHGLYLFALQLPHAKLKRIFGPRWQTAFLADMVAQQLLYSLQNSPQARITVLDITEMLEYALESVASKFDRSFASSAPQLLQPVKAIFEDMGATVRPLPDGIEVSMQGAPIATLPCQLLAGEKERNPKAWLAFGVVAAAALVVAYGRRSS